MSDDRSLQNQIHKLDVQMARLISHAESESGLAAGRDREIRASIERIEDSINGDNGVIPRLNGHSKRLGVLEHWQTGLTTAGATAGGIIGVMLKVMWDKVADRVHLG